MNNLYSLNIKRTEKLDMYAPQKTPSYKKIEGEENVFKIKRKRIEKGVTLGRTEERRLEAKNLVATASGLRQSDHFLILSNESMKTRIEEVLFQLLSSFDCDINRASAAHIIVKVLEARIKEELLNKWSKES